MAYLKPKFDIASIKRDILAQAQRIEDAIIQNLQLVGERAVINARNLSTYKDQTGNLRSSIGYIILKNGKVVFGSDFEVAKQGSEGSRKGKDLILSIAAAYPVGYVLIIVAGMDYALYVEANGKDVLTGTSLIAKAALEKALKTLAAKTARL